MFPFVRLERPHPRLVQKQQLENMMEGLALERKAVKRGREQGYADAAKHMNVAERLARIAKESKRSRSPKHHRRRASSSGTPSSADTIDMYLRYRDKHNKYADLLEQGRDHPKIIGLARKKNGKKDDKKHDRKHGKKHDKKHRDFKPSSTDSTSSSEFVRRDDRHLRRHDDDRRKHPQVNNFHFYERPEPPVNNFNFPPRPEPFRAQPPPPRTPWWPNDPFDPRLAPRTPRHAEREPWEGRFEPRMRPGTPFPAEREPFLGRTSRMPPRPRFQAERERERWERKHNEAYADADTITPSWLDRHKGLTGNRFRSGGRGLVDEGPYADRGFNRAPPRHGRGDREWF